MTQMFRSASILSFSSCTVLKGVMIVAVPLAFPSVWVGVSSMVMVQQARLPLCWFLQFCQHTDLWGLQSDVVGVMRVLSGRLGAAESLKGKGKGNTARMKRDPLLSAMCHMLANPQQTEQKTLFSLLAGVGKLGNDSVNRELLLLFDHSAWAVSILFSVPASSSSFPKLWHFEVHIWGITDFAFSLSVKAWSLCIFGLLIKYNVFKEKGEFMEEPVLFSLWKIPVPHLECHALIAAWELGEIFLVLAYICICCLGREMGLLWAPGGLWNQHVCHGSDTKFLQALVPADLFLIIVNVEEELNINVNCTVCQINVPS